MNQKLLGAALVSLPLIAGGLVMANSMASNKSEKPPQASQELGYTCPLTGEELPCPKCCPINDGK